MKTDLNLPRMIATLNHIHLYTKQRYVVQQNDFYSSEYLQTDRHEMKQTKRG